MGSQGGSSLKMKGFCTLLYKIGPKVNDLNKTITSKICAFVLRNRPIVLSELDAMIVRCRPNDILTDVHVCRSNVEC